MSADAEPEMHGPRHPKAGWRVDWDNVPDLGRVPDAVLARRFGVAPRSVGEARERRGIPRHEKRTARRPRVRHAGLDALEPMLGVVTDAELSRRSGIPAQVIRARRLELGIPRAGG